MNKKLFLWMYGILIGFLIIMTVLIYVNTTFYNYKPVSSFEKIIASPFFYFFLIVWSIVEAQFFWHRFTKAQLKIILEQKTEIETINSEITASIRYAKFIQSAVLPRKDLLDSHLNDYFIIFKPRDIVSGDFYWFTNIENKSIIAAVDCTGHGVPGAFMSMLGSAFLNEIINKEYITHPGVILRRLRKEVIQSMQQRGEAGEQKDGMDIALCAIDYKNMKLQFAGANNPLYLIRKSEGKNLQYENPLILEDFKLYDIKGDRMPVGIFDTMDNFTMHEIDLVEGDMVYLFSDGFADQFGGPAGKKLQYRNFKKMLLNHCSGSMQQQKLFLEKTLEEWQGDYKQVDDILLIGIRIN